MPELTNGDVTLWYAERGDPDGLPVVLTHGLFFSRRMFERLAAALPEHRWLLLDLRNHGRSSRPTDQGAYSWSAFGSDVVALLDHLGIERAVVGGLSLGANVTLAVAAEHTARLRGAIVEMPVLDHGAPVGERLFGPLAELLARAGALLSPLSSLTGPLRRSPVPELGALADVASIEPVAGAAMLRALLAEGAPGGGAEALAAHAVPTLVIGHHLDGLHPMADAEAVADAVPGATLARVPTILDLRLRPDRYAAVVGGFLAELGD